MITSTALLLALAQGGIHKSPFGTTKDGKAVSAYELTNAKGAKATIITFGGIVTRIQMPDRNGELGDVVLGHDRLAPYDMNGPYFGAIVGRYANRIAKGRFHLLGKNYKLAVNNGPNSLHGGLKGYDKRVWKATPMTTAAGPALKLTLKDPAGTEGYPGTVNVAVTYTLTNDNTLRIVYHATTTAPTPINLTNHSYFNLKDAGASRIDDHILRLYANRYTPVDSTLIPTGQLAPVAGTVFDFTTAKRIGESMEEIKGYDHNFVLEGGARLHRAAGVIEPTTGRTMECWTTEPGVQLYTSFFLDGTITGRNGTKYDQYHAFCLETQHFPDSPNKPGFPTSIITPKKPFNSVTEYRFGTVK